MWVPLIYNDTEARVWVKVTWHWTDEQRQCTTSFRYANTLFLMLCIFWVGWGRVLPHKQYFSIKGDRQVSPASLSTNHVLHSCSVHIIYSFHMFKLCSWIIKPVISMFSVKYMTTLPMCHSICRFENRQTNIYKVSNQSSNPGPLDNKWAFCRTFKLYLFSNENETS